MSAVVIIMPVTRIDRYDEAPASPRGRRRRGKKLPPVIVDRSPAQVIDFRSVRSRAAEGKPPA